MQHTILYQEIAHDITQDIYCDSFDHDIEWSIDFWLPVSSTLPSRRRKVAIILKRGGSNLWNKVPLEITWLGETDITHIYKFYAFLHHVLIFIWFTHIYGPTAITHIYCNYAWRYVLQVTLAVFLPISAWTGSSSLEQGTRNLYFLCTIYKSFRTK